jgi:hypothetical protein
MSASVFTVGKDVEACQVEQPPNDLSYDLAVIQFNDDGTPADTSQLTAAATCISQARRNPNGAIVLLFIHGWHHNAEWNTATDEGDSHFRAFRDVLFAITRREAERYFPTPAGRRVVGIYIGWNGDPSDSWLTNAGPLTHLSFWNRYSTAKRIGDGSALRDTIRTIVARTKDRLPSETTPPAPPPESPLILIGHSMGAVILESAFLALLKDSSNPLVRESPNDARIVAVHRAGQRVSFPDVVIALNSAADSTILKEIRKELDAQKITKTLAIPSGVSYEPPLLSYAPPLLISATSTADDDTKILWRAANLPWPGHTTDGHDATLFTHEFQRGPVVTCNPRGFVDFGQSWHCLRAPEPPNVKTPSIAVDLPARDRRGTEDHPFFSRYILLPLGDVRNAHTTWVFQLPPEIVPNHNDIFNSRASSLILALIQASGAVLSLAEDLNRTFE